MQCKSPETEEVIPGTPGDPGSPRPQHHSGDVSEVMFWPLAFAHAWRVRRVGRRGVATSIRWGAPARFGPILLADSFHVLHGNAGPHHLPQNTTPLPVKGMQMCYPI